LPRRYAARNDGWARFTVVASPAAAG